MLTISQVSRLYIPPSHKRAAFPQYWEATRTKPSSEGWNQQAKTGEAEGAPPRPTLALTFSLCSQANMHTQLCQGRHV